MAEALSDAVAVSDTDTESVAIIVLLSVSVTVSVIVSLKEFDVENSIASKAPVGEPPAVFVDAVTVVPLVNATVVKIVSVPAFPDLNPVKLTKALVVFTEVIVAVFEVDPDPIAIVPRWIACLSTPVAYSKTV